jgi:ADP-heptose:LPS heptosyltransferase
LEILVIRPRFLGDIILSTPLLSLLKNEYPGCRITYLLDKRYAPVLEENPDVDKIVYMPKGFKETIRIWKDLRKIRFDAVIDLFCNPRTAILVEGVRSKLKIGYNVGIRGIVYSRKIIPPLDNLSAILSHLSAATQLGIDIKEFPTRFCFREGERESLIDREIADFKGKGKLIGLYTGGSHQSKIWLKEYFIELGKLLETVGVRTIVLYGPEERDNASELCKGIGASSLLAPESDIRKLSALLSICDLVIGNDCGTMHLSVAVNTPTWSIFGAEDPRIWFPYEHPHKALVASASCRPCHKTSCNSITCLKDLKPEYVMSIYREQFA